MSKLKSTPDWLRANPGRIDVSVDRSANVLRGYVVAQEGAFKSAGRGAFDVKSLKQIVSLMNKAKPLGLKSRFAHPTLSDDGVGKFLGRVKNPRLDNVKIMRDGEPVLLHAVRGDLHFDPTSLDQSPAGGKPLGQYVMDLAESDPEALSSSLVLQYDGEEQLDPKTGRQAVDVNGEPLPPLWRPTALHASDVVDTGDAVDGILSATGLSAEGMPDELVRRVAELLGKAFPGAARDVVEARINAYRDRYLAFRYGDGDDHADEPPPPVEKSGFAAGELLRLELLELLTH